MKRAAAAVVDFVVGDDAFVAAGVGLALLVAWAAVRLGADPWWLLGLAVPAVLGLSLWRALGRVGRRSGRSAEETERPGRT